LDVFLKKIEAISSLPLILFGSMDVSNHFLLPTEKPRVSRPDVSVHNIFGP